MPVPAVAALSDATNSQTNANSVVMRSPRRPLKRRFTGVDRPVVELARSSSSERSVIPRPSLVAESEDSDDSVLEDTDELFAPLSPASTPATATRPSRIVGVLLLVLLLTTSAAFGLLLAALFLSNDEPTMPLLGIDPPCSEFSTEVAPRAPSLPPPPCNWAWRGWRGLACGPSMYCRMGVSWRPLPHPTCRARY